MLVPMSACPACATENTPGARFCSGCGASLAATCPSCGVDLPSGARFCPACGTPIAAGGPADALKLVTVLFADVVRSTARAEQMHPEDMRALMSDYFETMAEEIRGEGGTIEKFIGDAVMAVFGVPAAHEDDPVRAVRAARRMLERLAVWNAERDPASRIEIRIGVNTGDVLAAASPGRDLIVTGDAVNVAARLQQAAESGTIIVGERTARSVRGFYELRRLDPLPVKGKAEPVPVWLIEGERAVPEARGVPGLGAPMIGRESELEVLQTTFARVRRESAPHLVTIIGDAGVGKSRLVREFIASLDVRVKVIAGRCLPYGEGVTLWPLGEILKAEAVILGSDPPAVALEKITQLVREVIPGELAPQPERTMAALASTIGLQLPNDPLASLDPRELHRDLLAAWRALLAALGARAPHVLIVEDLHWADQAMLDVLDDLAERVAGPVLFLCPARPDLLRSRPDWGGGRRNWSALPLDPLRPEEGERLISFLLAIEELPLGLKERILAKAEGNPFFLEEIVRQLIDEGHLVQQDGRWRAGAGIAEVEIPDSVQAVILARLDLLAPAEKKVVQKAAVVGRDFWPGAVARLAAVEQLEEILRTLRRRELVVERLSSSLAGEPEYAFKHILIRDVAYESLPRRERAPAHAEFAAWIEERSGERAGELAELLAHHYEQAYSFVREEAFRERARAYCLTAARNALRRFALQQVQVFGQRAVELSLPGEERVEALEALGDRRLVIYDGDGAWQAYSEAIEEVRAGGGDAQTLTRLAAKATIVPTRWRGSMQTLPPDDEVERIIEVALEAAGERDAPDRALLLTSKAFLLARVYEERGEGAEHAARTAVEISERLDDANLGSAALDGLGSIFLFDGRYGELHKTNLRRVELAGRLTDLNEIGDSYAMAAWSAVHVGRYREAAEYATQCIERTRNVDPHMCLHGLAWRVWAMFMAGDWEDALEDQDEIERLEGELSHGRATPHAVRAYGVAAFCSELRGDEGRTTDYLGLLNSKRAGMWGQPFAARALAHRGEPEEAESFLNLEERRLGVNLDGLCEVIAVRGDWQRAKEVVALARAEAEARGVLPLRYFADRLDGLLATASNEQERAESLLRRSAEGFAALGAPWEEAWSRLLVGEALTASCRSVDADQELSAALATFERLDSVRESERAVQLLADRAR